MVTAMYAKKLRDTSVKVNAANPGYCTTDFNGQQRLLCGRARRRGRHQVGHAPRRRPNGIFWGDLSAVADSDEDTTSGVLAW